MTTEWDDLGDDELLRRLVQRGVTHDLARYLVSVRERSHDARRQISRRLAR